MSDTTTTPTTTPASSAALDGDLDLIELQQRVEDAVVQAFPPSDSGTCITVTFTPSYIISQYDDGCYQVCYSLDDDGEVVLGERSEVETEAPAAEATRICTRATESMTLTATPKSEKGWKWNVRILRSGLTKTANAELSEYGHPGKYARKFYTEDAVSESAALFNSVPLVLRDPSDHLGYANGSKKRFAVNGEIGLIGGSFGNCKATPVGESVVVEGVLSLKRSGSGPAMREFLLSRPADHPYELSWTGTIECDLIGLPADPVLRVHRISEVLSVDPVPAGNAGGLIMQAAESPFTTFNSMHHTTVPSTNEPLVDYAAAKIAEMERRSLRAEIALSRSHLESALSNSNLPTAVRDHVRETFNEKFDTGHIAESAEIDTFIRKQKELLSKIAPSFNGGFEVTQDAQDKAQAGVYNLYLRHASAAVKKAAAEMLGEDYSNPKYHNYRGFQSLYLDVTGAREIGDGWGIGAKGVSRASESIAAGQVTALAGDAMHKVMLAAYRSAIQWNDFEKVSQYVPVVDFKPYHFQNFGYFASPLSTISKGSDYAEINISGAEDVYATLVEQGGLFSIDWIDIVNDNVGMLTRVPVEAGIGCKKQLYKAVFDRLALGTSTDWQSSGTNEISTGHSNFSAGKAITGTNVADLATKMAVQTNIQGDVIGLQPRYLIYPATQWTAAYPVLTPAAFQANANGSSAAGPMNLVATADQSLGLEGIRVAHWTNSKNFWALAASPDDAEGIKILTYQGNTEPKFVQEATEAGKSFTAKQTRFRLEHHWKVALADYRPFVGASLS